jgi:hypothetical protein
MLCRFFWRFVSSDFVHALPSWFQQSFSGIIFTCRVCSLRRRYFLERQRQQFVPTLQRRHIQSPKRIILSGSLPTLSHRSI